MEVKKPQKPIEEVEKPEEKPIGLTAEEVRAIVNECIEKQMSGMNESINAIKQTAEETKQSMHDMFIGTFGDYKIDGEKQIENPEDQFYKIGD